MGGEGGKRLVIVGGGAAGLAAAVAAGEKALEAGFPLQVTVLERDDRVGRTILATGNGRCNFSNADPQAGCYHNAQFVQAVFDSLARAYGNAAGSGAPSGSAAGSEDSVHAFFRVHGMAWRQEDDGRQYPKTNKASTVVDVLRASAAALGVREACNREVKSIEPPRAAGKPFTLRMSDGVLERADAVVVACGGRLLHALDAGPLSASRSRPVLGPLRVSPGSVRVVRELDNIRVRCSVALARSAAGAQPGGGQAGAQGAEVVARESGELMFRKYGVSGICVFNLSRHMRPGDYLLVNFLDDCDEDEAGRLLFARRKMLLQRFPRLTCADMLRGLLLPRVAEAALKQAGLRSGQPFAKADVPALAHALTQFALEVEGTGDAELCQVRRGGFDVAGFDAATMEAHGTPGLYAAGEALDVDGPCGGYNLHWAWSSGLLAGMSAASGLLGCGSGETGPEA